MKRPPWHGWITALLMALTTATVQADEGLAVSPSSLSLNAGATALLQVKDASRSLRVEVDDAKVIAATVVGRTIQVTAKAAGSTQIEVRDGERKAEVRVRVAGTSAALGVTPQAATLAVGASVTLQATNVSGRLKATVGNTRIATARVSGNRIQLTGRAAGTTSLQISDGKGRVNLPVSVSATASSTLGVTPQSATLSVGASTTLQAANVNGTLRATVADARIAGATVSGNRIQVTGLAAGATSLQVSDGKGRVNVTVSVTASPSRTLSVTPSVAALTVGASATLQATNVNGTLQATVADTRIARVGVSGNQIQVTGLAAGATQVQVQDGQSRVNVALTVSAGTGPVQAAAYSLLAWNDLGMHCMDGDFSVFAILPPYNNLHAQLVNKSTNEVVTQGVTLTYQSIADAAGSVNTHSADKNNFWQFDLALFGADLTPNIGLTGNATPSYTASPMKPDAVRGLFVADGIPITPYDDSNRRNPYPMVKVIARDGLGKELASARVVLPVSDEMSCAACHASGTGVAARPAAGWVNDAKPERDWKRNILRLHDEKQAGKAAYAGAIQTLGYNAAGLAATADGGRPVLCAACHASNALPGTGVAGVKPLTEAIHAHHAQVKDPVSGQALDAITNRTSCYQCHPGSETKCLRGAMGDATNPDGTAAMGCQSCHGPMSAVGRHGRVGWLEQPNCQACHHDGKRELSAVTGGVLRTWTDARYATTPNTPASGVSLYRFSEGHGNLQCEACHGATHAEYPSSHANDNVLAQDLQGHAGTIRECSVCHTKVPLTATGGPHGLHTFGASWVSEHGDQAEKNPAPCAYCHGADYRGGALSQVKSARSFNAEGRTVNYQAGQRVGCYDCHNGPNGD